MISPLIGRLGSSGGGVFCGAYLLAHLGDMLRDTLLVVAEFVQHLRQQLRHLLGGNERPAPEHVALGRQQAGGRPAALRVARVDIGTLVGIDAHGDELLVDVLRDGIVAKRLLVHRLAEWHQLAYSERKTGLFCFCASAKTSSPQGRQAISVMGVYVFPFGSNSWRESGFNPERQRLVYSMRCGVAWGGNVAAVLLSARYSSAPACLSILTIRNVMGTSRQLK